MRQTILIVDDEPANIDLLAECLKTAYNVKATTHGEQALDIARSGDPPDMILLDIMMPSMDGFEVCRQLKADLSTQHIPIIFITSKSNLDDEVRGLELGAVDYIAKPISAPIVQTRVRTQLALINHQRLLDGKVREQTELLHESRLTVIRRLGRAAEYKDNETGLHVIRMSHYAAILARAIGIDERNAELLLNAAPMHDIGKIGIPDSILQKPARLTPDEWDVMRTHAQIGADIIGDGSDSELLEMAQLVALTHHEKWDGSGYPNGLAGEDIPLVGRIVAVVDVFDALTSVRPYKPAWPIDKALDLLRDERGAHFDPRLVPPFLEAMPEILEIRARYAENGMAG